MQDTKGKVILSLLAGATAGIVAGLLLAPEIGDQTRAGLKESASKFGDDLNKLLKEGLARLNSLKEQAPPASAQQESDRSAADSLLGSIDTPGGFTQPDAAIIDNTDSDYDGIGDAYHSGNYGKGL